MSRSLSSGYRDVDHSPDRAQLSRFLRAMRAEPLVLEAKRRSFELCQLSHGSSVLDVGCGNGDDVLDLAALVGPEGSATGVDRSDALLEEARSSARSRSVAVGFSSAEADSLPFPDNHFDAARADRVIQHIADADEAVAEMIRVVRPAGLVVISETYSRLDLKHDEDPDCTQAIFDQRWTARERRGWIAPLLPLVMAQAGLAEISVARDTAVLNDFGAVSSVLDLDALCASALRNADLGETAVAAWRENLRAKFASGDASLHWQFFHVVGHKPGEGTDDR